MPDPGRDRIVCFGDVIDDVVAVPSGALRRDTDTPATIRFRPGGSPANTAAWLGALGAPVDFVGIVGAADVARHVAALPGVTTHVAGHPTLSTGAIVVLVEGQTRSMLTDRGANRALDPDAVTPALLEHAAVLHVTGHALLNDAGATGFRSLLDRAAAASVPVSLAPGSEGFIADYGVAEFRAATTGATVLFPSLAEGRLLTGLSDPRAIARALAAEVSTVVLTLGTEGVIVASDGTLTDVPAATVDVVDPTGAGDSFCAGFLAAWVRDRDVVAAARAGTRVAARALSSIGARPQP